MKDRELLLKLQEFQIDQLPFRFSFNEERFKNTFIAGIVKYINNLLEKFHNVLESRKTKEDKIKSIIPPAIFDSSVQRKRPRSDEKADIINLYQFHDKLFSKNREIKLIDGYSTGTYHYNKEEDTDLVFYYLDISPANKGFFIGKISEKDVNKKIMIFSLLNFMFRFNKKNITSAERYLADINSCLYNAGPKELSMHAAYIILNPETNYIEIASTRFSPLIHYRADIIETAYYEFSSAALGLKHPDTFSGILKKESFQLFPGDIILLPDPDIENLTSVNKEKFEVHRITDTVNKYRSTTADIIAEKIKGTFNQFTVDFSKLNDLFILVIRRNLKNE